MLNDIGLPGFILLAVLALLLFGPSKLPGLGRSAGRALREVRREMKEIMGDAPSKGRTVAVKTVQASNQQAEEQGRTSMEQKLPE